MKASFTVQNGVVNIITGVANDTITMDSMESIGPGESWGGVTYEEMEKIGSGELEIGQKSAKIVKE
jgi:hypothetical protein